ncbi:hypothetical protein AYI70_g4376 [Smittium culicis]|uniref:Uncharacterized protein n=1 Tax=Smittium culicis TaxID=133412 RepID=A0A1R1XZB1_9FUNG|nr:hypothetical protein AYI70_g4376 [Smittium culicis]
MGENKKHAASDSESDIKTHVQHNSNFKNSNKRLKTQEPDQDSINSTSSNTPSSSKINDNSYGVNNNEDAIGEIEFNKNELNQMLPKEIYAHALSEINLNTSDSRLVATRLLEEAITKYEQLLSPKSPGNSPEPSLPKTQLQLDYFTTLITAAEYIGYIEYAKTACLVIKALQNEINAGNSDQASGNSSPASDLLICTLSCKAEVLAAVLDPKYFALVDDSDFSEHESTNETAPGSSSCDKFFCFDDLFRYWETSTNYKKFPEFAMSIFKSSYSALEKPKRFLYCPETIMASFIEENFDFENCQIKAENQQENGFFRLSNNKLDTGRIVDVLKLLAQVKLLKISSFLVEDDEEVLNELDEATRFLKAAQSLCPEDQAVQDLLDEILDE